MSGQDHRIAAEYEANVKERVNMRQAVGRLIELETSAGEGGGEYA